VEHVGGIFLFIASLVAKSLRASKRGRHHHSSSHGHKHSKKVGGNREDVPVIEMGGGSMDASNTSMCSPLQLRRKALGDDAV